MHDGTRAFTAKYSCCASRKPTGTPWNRLGRWRTLRKMADRTSSSRTASSQSAGLESLRIRPSTAFGRQRATRLSDVFSSLIALSATRPRRRPVLHVFFDCAAATRPRRDHPSSACSRHQTNYINSGVLASILNHKLLSSNFATLLQKNGYSRNSKFGL